MEKLSHKNAVIVTEAISNLVDAITNQACIDSSLKQVELKQLKEKLSHSNPLVSATVFEGLLQLVKQEYLDVLPTVSTIISVLPSISHYSSVTSTLIQLLIIDLQRSPGNYTNQFNMTSPQFPLITVLRSNVQSWYDVLLSFETVFTINDKRVQQNKMKLFRPFLLYIFNDLTPELESLKIKVFSILLLHINELEVQDQILEILSWLPWNISSSLHIESLCVTLETQYNQHKKTSNVDYYMKLIAAVCPLLAATINWLIENGYNAALCITFLKLFLNITKDSAAVVLAIIAERISYVPITYLADYLTICHVVIETGNCNPILAHVVASQVLNWLVFPSSLTQHTSKASESLITLVNSNTTWKEDNFSITYNSSFTKLQYCSSDIDRALRIVKLTDSLSKVEERCLQWLSNVNASHSTLVSGVFLNSTNTDTCLACINYFIKTTKIKPSLSGIFLSGLLFRFSKEVEPSLQFHLLFGITKMAVDKENIPLIISTIASINLKPHRVTTSLSTRLYFALWEVEPRTYPYLLKCLTSTTQGDSELEWEVCCCKAQTLKQICILKPSLHGKELVPILSEILNQYGKSSSGLPSALAIDAITELCKAHIVDIAGTWKALQPKLSKDKRPEVIESLCQMFSLIPKLKTTEQDWRDLINDIIIRLWTYTELDNTKSVKAALKTIAFYKMEDCSLKSMPEKYRKGIKLPSEFAKTPIDAARRPEDVLTYVPGECWIQVLEKVNEDVLQEAGDMLITMIQEEINTLPKGLYHLPEGALEPTTYTYLPHRSVLRGLVEHLRKNAAYENLTATQSQILRIICHPYSKHLPPLNWMFMENILLFNESWRLQCLQMFAKQGPYSVTCKKMVQNFMFNYKPDLSNMREVVSIYNNLPSLCCLIPPNILRTFVESSLEIALKSSIDGLTDELYFHDILSAVQAALSGNIHEANRSLLVMVLEGLLDRIPSDIQVFTKYSEVVTNLPVINVERMSNPSLWWEVTPDKLKKAIIIRTAIGVREDSTAPTLWINECIDAAGAVPSVHFDILDSVSILLTASSNIDTTSKWLLGLMGRIQQSMFSQESLVDSIINTTNFLIDVLFCSLIQLSAYNSICCDDVTHSKEVRYSLLPGALALLFADRRWTNILSNVVEWCHRVLTWTYLSGDLLQVIQQVLVSLRDHKYCREPQNWPRLFFIN